MRLLLKTSLVLLFSMALSQSLQAQKISRAQTETNGFYYWNTNANWTTSPAAPTTNIGNPLQNAGGNEQIRIEGYISRNGSLGFANIGANTKEIVIKDTLVVYGSVTFPANSYSLKMLPNSVLIVLGNFSAANKVTVDNGGLIIIDGNMSLTGGNQTYTDTNGGSPNLVVTGTISGNGDTAAASADNTALTTQSPAIQNFVTGGGTTPLPIELMYFNGATSHGSVNLKWATASETNNDYFTIERSTNGTDYHAIGTLPGAGTSIETISYHFVDSEPIFGKSYYRLKQTDYDGTSETFKPVLVDFTSLDVENILFTNPGNVGEEVTVYTNADENETLTLTVINMMGQTILEQKFSGASHTFLLNSNMKPGVYLLKVASFVTEKTGRLLVN